MSYPLTDGRSSLLSDPGALYLRFIFGLVPVVPIKPSPATGDGFGLPRFFLAQDPVAGEDPPHDPPGEGLGPEVVVELGTYGPTRRTGNVLLPDLHMIVGAPTPNTDEDGATSQVCFTGSCALAFAAISAFRTSLSDFICVSCNFVSCCV